ncbi:MAG: hypothetical protein JSU63_13790 [Phycisphaerales bacterium]|nr:MAG: hypothetical protein JSU63_13790 [Phycisphaerales bacterium]
MNTGRLATCVVILAVIMHGGRVSGADRPKVRATADRLAPEQQVVYVPIEGDLVTTCGPRCAEVSGLAWCGDDLIILPQYPELFTTKAMGIGARIFTIPKTRILTFLDGRSSAPVRPRGIVLVDQGLGRRFKAPEIFEGYESIAFFGDRAFLTIETKTNISTDSSTGQTATRGYLVAGRLNADHSELRIDPDTLRATGSPSHIHNMADESVIVFPGAVMSLYEANGANVNPRPIAHAFDSDLREVKAIPMPNIEYRITDVTAADEQGRFWAVNFFFAGDARRLDPAVDELSRRHGIGKTHARYKTVERLVELAYEDGRISLTSTIPIYLQLVDDDQARNWEGVVRLDDRGFLLMADEYPKTILAFVPAP